VETLVEEALAAFINPVEIMELEKIGVQGIPQLTVVNTRKTGKTGVAKIRKTDRIGAAKINKTDRIPMTTNGITIGMVATTIMVAIIITVAAGVDIIVDWR
jgi:hypothetical protein